MGTVVVELYWKHAPNTCRNFAELSRRGYYNGIKFHRIISDFMIQGGDPTGTGMFWDKNNSNKHCSPLFHLWWVFLCVCVCNICKTACQIFILTFSTCNFQVSFIQWIINHWIDEASVIKWKSCMNRIRWLLRVSPVTTHLLLNSFTLFVSTYILIHIIIFAVFVYVQGEVAHQYMARLLRMKLLMIWNTVVSLISINLHTFCAKKKKKSLMQINLSLWMWCSCEK